MWMQWWEEEQHNETKKHPTQRTSPLLLCLLSHCLVAKHDIVARPFAHCLFGDNDFFLVVCTSMALIQAQSIILCFLRRICLVVLGWTG